MTINTHKKKIMIIKSKKDTFANFIYDIRNLEEVSSYKYLGNYIHHKLHWKLITLRKRLMEGGKLILVFNITEPIWSCRIKQSSYLKLLSSLFSCMVVKYGGATFLENLRGRLSKSLEEIWGLKWAL